MNRYNQEKLEAMIEDNLVEQWGDEFEREADLLNHAWKKPHRRKWKIVLEVEAHREKYIDENWNEKWDDVLDGLAEQSNPLGYRGLHRSDFF